MPRATKARVLEPLFHNRQVTPANAWASGLPWVNDFIGILRRCGVRWSLLLDSITRETHQRQLTLGLWPARWRREGSTFEDTQFSVAKQPCKETTDDLGYVNAFPRCPPVLGYRKYSIAHEFRSLDSKTDAAAK